LRPAVELAHVVDDGTILLVLPIARFGTTERLYLRGADLAIINSGACALLALAYLEEDGLVLLLALVAAPCSLAVTGMAVWGAVETIDWIDPAIPG
jgi:Cu/Ag efflux pump CusA